MTKYRSGILVSVAMLSMALTACGGKEKEKVGPFERCQSIFKIIATDAKQPTAMCNCLKSKVGMEGVEAFGTAGSGSDKVREIARSCARESGLELPGTADAAGR